MERKRERWLVAAPMIYVCLTIFSNLGSLRVLNLASFSLDGGTLLYPLSFTARDMLQKKVGEDATRLTVWLAALANLALFAFCWLVSVLPADGAVGPQTEFGLVLLPGFRLVIGSVVAMLVSGLLDTKVFSLVRRRYGSRKQWLRVLASNLISTPVDTVIFLAIAFGGRYPTSVLLSMFLSNIILKYAVTLCSLWGVYLVKEDRD